ncbi:MAG: ImmA/IrrE family metallo-endopeptidase [Methanobrevibacter arboriphilus]|uniref:ImmA/IrrE family metallo-endopeptidase n=1 Tax=Methanobrevibacter arboriphilus TaxID=39441 RepID=A0A843ADU3_METAZ|nr:ImmA/IrrE family metallo-endopeptidase [Methanobrevibacter arboriphilus]
MMGYLETNQLAEKLRRRWGFDNYSPLDIFSIAIEKLPNLTLILLPLGKNISGCCSKINNDQLILINSEHSKGRQNFTLAHELYHLIYEDNEEWLICGHDANSSSEEEANNFASSLLMPDGALSEYERNNNIDKWDLENIIHCEQFFQISHDAMLYRLRFINDVINYDEFKKYRPGVKNEAMKLGFGTELYDPSPDGKKYFSFGNYIRLTEKAFENNEISIGKKNELLLDVFRSDIIYNLKEGDFID